MSDDITERKARWLMFKAVQAVKHCHECEVFYGDIQAGNILVNLHSLELKLIYFRCARIIGTEAFNSSEYQDELVCLVTVTMFGAFCITLYCLVD